MSEAILHLVSKKIAILAIDFKNGNTTLPFLLFGCLFNGAYARTG